MLYLKKAHHQQNLNGPAQELEKMAGYPGMKPMLQFTNQPPPPRVRRRRKRKPVKTPEEPRVRSIPLAQACGADDQENLPRPYLKWVSPTNKKNTIKIMCLSVCMCIFMRICYSMCEKERERVNVCVQKLLHTVYVIQVSPQFYDELTENGTHLKDHNPRLRKKMNKTKQPLEEVKELFPNESSANSQQCPKSTTRRNPLNFKQNSDQHLVLGAGRTQRKFRSSSAGWCSQEISMYPSTCGPRSKQKPRSYEDESTDDSLTDGENDQCQLHVRCNEELDDRGCPSLSADQKLQLDDCAHSMDGGGDDHTVPSASQEDDMRDDHFGGIRLRLSATNQYSEVSNPTQCKHTQCTCSRQREGIATDHPELNPVQVPHSSMRRTSTHTCTAQSIHQQDECSICPKQLADNATNARGTHNDGGQNNISYPSMENLSELMKDMSVGDDLATNNHSLPVDDRNPSTSEHTMSCNMYLKPDESIRPQNCTTTRAPCSHRNLSTVDFNPHSASTPCRDQHVQMVDQTFNSISQKSLTATRTARAEVTRHLEEQEMSILVRETPEHLWCSPNLYSIETHRAECASEQSFRVSESVFQPAGLKSQVCNDSPNPLELPPQHMSCKLSDIDMTTFTNFDNTSGSHTTLGESHSKSMTEDKHECLHLTIPPTQDSTHGSEGEWSVLVKQTPDEFWSSPVIRVVNDSLNLT